MDDDDKVMCSMIYDNWNAKIASIYKQRNMSDDVFP